LNASIITDPASAPTRTTTWPGVSSAAALALQRRDQVGIGGIVIGERIALEPRFPGDDTGEKGCPCGMRPKGATTSDQIRRHRRQNRRVARHIGIRMIESGKLQRRMVEGDSILVDQPEMRDRGNHGGHLLLLANAWPEK
jgi:hypothetical protein